MAERVCPWWLGYFLASPIRRLWQKPEEILQPHVQPGMTVLDIGSGMGYFTLSMAELVGNTGKVVAVDLQSKMINSLRKRARKNGYDEIIETRVCSSESLGIDDLEYQVDFALAMAVVHEVPDTDNLLREIHRVLKSRGRLLIAEPSGHISENDYRNTESKAVKNGFTHINALNIKRSYAALFEKN